jgi:hypothetical protein
MSMTGIWPVWPFVIAMLSCRRFKKEYRTTCKGEMVRLKDGGVLIRKMVRFLSLISREALGCTPAIALNLMCRTVQELPHPHEAG